ncbi:MAG: ATP-binding protein [Sneathiellaceae bacterium]
MGGASGDDRPRPEGPAAATPGLDRLLDQAFHTSPAVIMAFAALRDGDGTILDFRCTLANPAAGTVLGRPVGELVGRRMSDTFTLAVTGGLLERCIDLVDSGTPVRMDLRQPTDRGERWFDLAAVQLADGVLLNMSDISLQKEAEDRLRRAERRLQRILDSALDGIITLDREQRVSSFNSSAEELFGYAGAEILGKPLDILLPPEQRGRHARLVAEFAAGPDRSRRMSEWRLVRGVNRRGMHIPLMASISKITVEGEPTLTVFLRDMSTTLRQEDELRARIVDLREQRQRAEQSSFAKSEFLAKVSHELRTPLNAILGFSEIMHSGLLGTVQPAAYHSYVADIHAGGRHLLSLIDDILDLSRIESQKVVLHREPVDIGGEIAESLRLLEIERSRREMTIRTAVPADLGPAIADRRSVQQILVNLLSNALHYGRQGGWIEVGAARSGGLVTLRVSDNGPGIAQKVIENLGQPFISSGSIYSDTRSGTGLGLAIVKGLAEAHGGRLQIDSDDNGATVTVTFPQPAA